MTLKLYGSYQSPCTCRVALVAKEAGVPIELIEVDLAKREHKAPDYLEKQPFGLVPYLVRSAQLSQTSDHPNAAAQDDDGFILFESRAIGRYIAAKSGNTSILPTEAKALALFEQAVSIEVSNFAPSAIGILYQHHVVKATDKALMNEYITTLNGKLEGYERILAKQKYIAGDNLTIADLSYLPYGSMLEPLGVTLLTDNEKYPNVAR